MTASHPPSFLHFLLKQRMSFALIQRLSLETMALILSKRFRKGLQLKCGLKSQPPPVKMPSHSLQNLRRAVLATELLLRLVLSLRRAGSPLKLSLAQVPTYSSRVPIEGPIPFRAPTLVKQQRTSSILDQNPTKEPRWDISYSLINSTRIIWKF
jgi:hypothetical protein